MVTVKNIKKQTIRANALMKANPNAKGLVVEFEEGHVVEGKLIFVQANRDDAVFYIEPKFKDRPPIIRYNTMKTPLEKSFYKPIIISETEPPIDGDWVYYNNGSLGQTSEKFPAREAIFFGWFKVLALPVHFSNEILQDITDYKLKDGDIVLIECEIDKDSLQWSDNTEGRQAIVNSEKDWKMKIKLDPFNMITLHQSKPIELYTQEQMDECWNDAVKSVLAVLRDKDSLNTVEAMCLGSKKREWFKTLKQ